MDKSKFNDRREWRKFGFGLTGILTIIAVIQLIMGIYLFKYLLSAAGVILLVSFLFPVALKPVFVIFSYIGFVMGWIMTRVILIILFYLVVTPISLVSRLTGKRFLNLDFSKKYDSYWISVGEKRQEKSQYEKQF